MLLAQVQGQSEGPPKYKGAIDCGKQIFKESGVKGLYRGTAVTLGRDIPGSMAYYGMYEIIRNRFAKEGKVSPGITLFAGGMAGVSVNCYTFTYNRLLLRLWFWIMKYVLTRCLP
tara:strand:- start:416 stop:760 length:345 start_codon:yes stop_codon:yes gene_type:complete